jgi:hypothetical protein
MPSPNPRKPKAPPVETVPLFARDLADFLADALLFTSCDDFIPQLHAVRIDVDKARLRAVSTDRYALGVRTMPYTGPAFPALLLTVPDARDLIAVLRLRLAPRGMLLARFARLSTLKGPGSRPLVIKTTGPHNGVQITVGSTDDFLGFLMPVRLSEQPNEVAA